jgi:hypothetical protein
MGGRRGGRWVEGEGGMGGREAERVHAFFEFSDVDNYLWLISSIYFILLV